MPMLVLLEVKAKANAVETLQTLMAAAFPDTRPFTGCQGIAEYSLF